MARRCYLLEFAWLLELLLLYVASVLLWRCFLYGGGGGGSSGSSNRLGVAGMLLLLQVYTHIR